MNDPDTKAHQEAKRREMVTVGQWQLVEIEIDNFSCHNPTVATDKTVELTDTFDSWRLKWRHVDKKTYLTVSRNHAGNFDAVVYMGRPDSVSVGPGWTCGVDCRNVGPVKAIEWAENYMVEHDDVSHLYDD